MEHTYQIMKHLKDNFRSKHFCESLLLITINDIAKDIYLQVDAAILDFSKAFDRVVHSKLLYKLNCHGIYVRGNVLQWLKSFICGCTQQVVVEGSACQVTSGVLQGSVLGY